MEEKLTFEELYDAYMMCLKNKKTKIDTAYHGVQFLGKVSYPYGYQRPSKQVIIRTYNKAKKIEYEDKQNLIAKVNAQIGTLKKYNIRLWDF